jgi:tRNA(Ile)-lysidine synthase TilS/MesJ
MNTAVNEAPPTSAGWTAPANADAPAAPPAAAGRVKIERETHKLEKRLCREVGKAIVDFNMIEEGDKVMVCMSGGKDSYTLLDILLKLQARAPIHFDLVAVNLDQKQPGFPEHVLPDYLRAQGIPFHMFFGGKMKSMPPKLVSDDGKHVVIRPLAYVPEKDTARWAQYRDFPIIPCNLCGSQENLQRKQVGEMLREWDKKFPGRVENMFNALQNLVPSHLLDGNLYDFKNARATGVADENGDKAFDKEEFAAPSPSLPGVQVVQLS